MIYTRAYLHVHTSTRPPLHPAPYVGSVITHMHVLCALKHSTSNQSRPCAGTARSLANTVSDVGAGAYRHQPTTTAVAALHRTTQAPNITALLIGASPDHTAPYGVFLHEKYPSAAIAFGCCLLARPATERACYNRFSPTILNRL
jgi:hypothetical protein